MQAVVNNEVGQETEFQERFPVPTVAEAEEDHIFCPFDAALDILTERWTLHILRTLLSGTKRFNEIAQRNGINAHTLRKRLEALETEGIVIRTVVSTMPPNVEYKLTEKGYALNRVFEEIAAWGRKYIDAPGHEDR